MDSASAQLDGDDSNRAHRPIRRREAIERTRSAEALAEIRNATVRGAEALGSRDA
jgi:hypothetical protein